MSEQDWGWAEVTSNDLELVDGGIEEPAQWGVLRAPRDDVVVPELLTGPTRKRQIHPERLVR